MDSLFSYIEENKKTKSDHLYTALPSVRPLYFKEIELQGLVEETAGLNEALSKRKSATNFSGEPLHSGELSAVLGATAGERDGKRSYPSAGKLYPIQVYTLIKNVIGISPGFYRYSPEQHTLGLLRDGVPSGDKIFRLYRHEHFKQAAALVVMSFIKGKSIRKYGSLCYPHAFFEAGHIGQNVYLAAAAVEIACCACGTAEYSELNKVYEFDGSNESYIYSVALGKE